MGQRGGWVWEEEEEEEEGEEAGGGGGEQIKGNGEGGAPGWRDERCGEKSSTRPVSGSVQCARLDDGEWQLGGACICPYRRNRWWGVHLGRYPPQDTKGTEEGSFHQRTIASIPVGTVASNGGAIPPNPPERRPQCPLPCVQPLGLLWDGLGWMGSNGME
jgi:hypothetical protein